MAEIQCTLFEDVKQVKDDIHVYDQTTKQILKRCTKCKNKYPLTIKYFSKEKKGKYGFQSKCKKCRSLINKIYSKDNKEKISNRSKLYYKKVKDKRKIQYQINKEKIKIQRKKYIEANKNKLKIRRKLYYESNKSQIKINQKKYRKENEDKLVKFSRKYRKSFSLYEAYYKNESLLLVEQIRCDSDNKGYLQVKCAYCGKWFNPTNQQTCHRINAIIGRTSGENRFYCNDNDNACKYACPIFRQRKYPKGFRKGTSREVAPELRQMCFERDSWECQKCGASIQEDTLHCHHIKGYTQNKILANDIDNVITLCKECHKEIHSQEGCKYHELQCHNE